MLENVGTLEKFTTETYIQIVIFQSNLENSIATNPQWLKVEVKFCLSFVCSENFLSVPQSMYVVEYLVDINL